MISIRVHRHVKYLIIFIIGFFAGGFFNVANAQSLVDYSRLPSGSGVYDSITVTATVDQQAVNDCLSTGFNDFVVQVYDNSFNTLGQSALVTPTTATINYVVNFTMAGNATYIILRCTPDVNFQFDLEIGSGFPMPTPLFTTIIYVAPPPPPPVVSEINFDFFDASTSPSDLIATVGGGVRDTGNDLWPLLAFLGVSLAFIIGLQLVVFSKRAVGTSNTKEFDMNAFNAKADELETFYSKTGGADPVLVEQIKKRGRGRPRKIDII